MDEIKNVVLLFAHPDHPEKDIAGAMMTDVDWESLMAWWEIGRPTVARDPQGHAALLDPTMLRVVLMDEDSYWKLARESLRRDVGEEEEEEEDIRRTARRDAARVLLG